MDDAEKASFSFGGQRARPRKGIEASFVKGQTYLKPPGSCGTKHPGVAISVDVECCEDCTICVLDVTEQVQVADCRNCRVIVGPCVGSVFLLDCVGCTFSIAARQLRLRDVVDSELRVFAPVDEGVVVESCKRLKFGAWDVAYPGLDAQFIAAGWASGPAGSPSASVRHNFWDRIFDFTPATESFSLMSASAQAERWRWAELTLAPSGLAGGTVDEARGPAPSVRGCECPPADADGVSYTADWYVGWAAADDAPTDVADVVLETGAATADADVTIQHSPSPGMFGWLYQLLLGFFALFGWSGKSAPRGTDAEAATEAGSAGAPAGGKSADGSSQMCAVM